MTTPLTTPATTTEAHPVDGVVTTTIEHPHGKHVVAIEHDTARVAVYWYTPEDGSAPYLVVDIDTEDDEPKLRVYVNDAPATLSGFRVVTA